MKILVSLDFGNMQSNYSDYSSIYSELAVQGTDDVYSKEGASSLCSL
jgi:hypothetical protein